MNQKATGYAAGALLVVLVTALARSLPPTIEPTNLAMLYLLSVVGVAIRFGRGPAACCALLGVLAFDYFCVPPHLSFAVSDIQYLFTFAVMLLVGILLAHLTAGLRQQADMRAQREHASHRLYELAQSLAGCVEPEKVCALLGAFVKSDFAGHAELWWEDSTHALGRMTSDELPVLFRDAQGHPPLLIVAVMESGQIRVQEDPARERHRLLLCPLDAPMRRRGVLAVTVPEARFEDLAVQQIGSLALLAATTLERLHYVDVAQGAMLDMERERLRSTILSALSHDLRTPLTVIVGRADTLIDEARGSSERIAGLAEDIRRQAIAMSRLTDNLLDLARLQSGQVRLRMEWQSVEEIVGAAVAQLQDRLHGRVLSIDLPADLPLVEFDAVLIERVLCNLLDNAVRHTPASAAIRITAGVEPVGLWIGVDDEGPGLPEALWADVFEPFVRGPAARADGLGLGLSICRLIVEAHGGTVQAAPSSTTATGTSLRIRLPRREPPVIEPERDAS